MGRSTAKSDRHILILEHDTALRSMFREAFQSAGYDVTAMDDAATAAAAVRANSAGLEPFSMVLLDIADDRSRHFISSVDPCCAVPIFLLREDSDKHLIINLLKQRKTDFIERFIESHASAQRSGYGKVP